MQPALALHENSMYVKNRCASEAVNIRRENVHRVQCWPRALRSLIAIEKIADYLITAGREGGGAGGGGA